MILIEMFKRKLFPTCFSPLQLWWPLLLNHMSNKLFQIPFRPHTCLQIPNIFDCFWREYFLQNQVTMFHFLKHKICNKFPKIINIWFIFIFLIIKNLSKKGGMKQDSLFIFCQGLALETIWCGNEWTYIVLKRWIHNETKQDKVDCGLQDSSDLI